MKGVRAARRNRDLAAEQVRYLFLDGWYPRVPFGKRRVVVPVLVVLGVRADGRKVLDLRLPGDESTVAWYDTSRSLVERHLGTPVLAVIDGSAGLRAALREQWPTLAVQRCATHKLRNLEAKAPKRQREELAEDDRRMIYARRRRWSTRLASGSCASGSCSARQCSSAWRKPATNCSRSCASRAQWRALRTTNTLERINEEFRRRTKTQAGLPSQDAVLLLLFGLLRSGQIRLRAIDGWQEIAGGEGGRVRRFLIS